MRKVLDPPLEIRKQGSGWAFEGYGSQGRRIPDRFHRQYFNPLLLRLL